MVGDGERSWDRGFSESGIDEKVNNKVATQIGRAAFDGRINALELRDTSVSLSGSVQWNYFDYAQQKYGADARPLLPLPANQTDDDLTGEPHLVPEAGALVTEPQGRMGPSSIPLSLPGVALPRRTAAICWKPLPCRCVLSGPAPTSSSIPRPTSFTPTPSAVTMGKAPVLPVRKPVAAGGAVEPRQRAVRNTIHIQALLSSLYEALLARNLGWWTARLPYPIPCSRQVRTKSTRHMGTPYTSNPLTTP